jgi:hypothetical protein
VVLALISLLLAFQPLIKPVICYRNVLGVPLFPFASLVSGDKEDGSTAWVKREQDSDFSVAR